MNIDLQNSYALLIHIFKPETLNLIESYIPQISFKMLSANAFKNLSPPEANKQYSTLYDKMEEKTKLIENYITKLDERLNKMELSTGKQKNPTSSILENKVRSFEPFLFTENAQNLVLGSSIVKKIMDDSLPGDVSVHAYSGSITREKIEIIDKYPEKNYAL